MPITMTEQGGLRHEVQRRQIYKPCAAHRPCSKVWGYRMILCCGEALVDMLPRQSMQGEPAFAPCPGGAAFNTAIAPGRLGVAVEFFSGLSNDPFGQQIRQALASSNAGTRHAHISERPTTLAFVRLVDGQASYQFHDENTAELNPNELSRFPWLWVESSRQQTAHAPTLQWRFAPSALEIIQAAAPKRGE